MQAIFRRINAENSNSFIARKDQLSVFYDKWHYHPEIELTHVIKSRGTRFVGDSIENFEEGDLVLIGSFLPHAWKNDVAYYNKDSNLTTDAEVLQFLPDFWGESFLNLPETKNINNLFEKAKRGLRIEGETKTKVAKIMSELISSKVGVLRMGLLLQILEEIATSSYIRFLSSQAFADMNNKSDREKINKVFDFTISQYNRKILIEEVASLINMSVPNFCKYFKNRSRKTYIQYLTEVRIGFACRMLIENVKSIQQIAFDCGFHNLSNFNRSFKLLKNQKPAEFRQTYGALG